MKYKKLKSMVMVLVVLAGVLSAAIGASAEVDPYIGEIVLFPYTYVPLGWASCDGQLLQISQNTALYSLLGNTFGGDGVTTFALPNLNKSAAGGITTNPLPDGKGFYCIATEGVFPERP